MPTAEAVYTYDAGTRHADHLNSPRQVYDENQALRWRWDQVEPFGASPVDENPAALGAFEFNLRFPGQYFDKETNAHYNYFRDYDPAIGRYVESDPIGLRGGLNTYSYVAGYPIGLTDPTGEAVFLLPFVAGGSTGIGSALLGGAAMAAILSVPGSTEQSGQQGTLTPEQEAAREAEHKRYKIRCEEKPPSGLDGCDLLRWLLQQAKDCRDMRQQWDDKWMPGRHAQAIREWGNRIRRLERLIAQKCTPCP